jgi:Protein of unknown function (DUF2510)
MTLSTHIDRQPLLSSRAIEPSPLGIIGGVLAIFSSFLAWDDMVGVAYDDAFEIPLQFLWDIDASGGFKLGLPLVIVAAVIALFSLSPLAPVVFLRRLGGVLLLAAVALFVVQLGRRFGWDSLDAGAGAWLAGAGGLLALLAPSGLWPVRRVRPQRAARRPPATPPPPLPGDAPPAMSAGWYANPEGGGQRYWDGENWTKHRAT